MTPLQLLEKLKQLGLNDKVLGKIRQQIEDPEKTVKVTAVLKYLVKKGQITEDQARNLLKKASDAKKKKAAAEAAPVEPIVTRHNTEDLTADFVPEEHRGAKSDVAKTRLDMDDELVEPVIDAVPVSAEPIDPVSLESVAVIDEAVFDYGEDPDLSLIHI